MINHYLRDKQRFGLIAIILVSISTVTIASVKTNAMLPILISILATMGIITFILILSNRPVILLFIFLIILPVNTLSLAYLFQLTGSQMFIDLLQPWKEIGALIVFSLFLFKSLLTFRVQRFHTLDLLVFLFLALNILYLILPWGSSFIIRLQAFRLHIFWFVVYWLGRSVPLSNKAQKLILGSLLGIGILAGLFTIVEVFFLPLTWPNHIGLMDYLGTFFNMSPRGNYGLTWTFETASGIRRRSAFFANPLELASSTLLTGAAAFYLITHFKSLTRGRIVSLISYGLITLSLILAVSRASLIAFFVQLLVMSIWLQKRVYTFLALGSGVVGIIVFLFFSGNSVRQHFVETITFENSSSQGHLAKWVEGLEAIQANPLGLGLGNSGHTGARFSTQVGGENQFIIIGVDLGIIGLVLYATILISAIWYARYAFTKMTGLTKALVFIAASANLGLLIPTFTSHIETYIFVKYLTWWLVGYSIQELMFFNKSIKVHSIVNELQEPLVANSR